MEKPFTRVGKQIMASGSHYADAADETAAQFMIDALNTKAFAVTEDLLAALIAAESLFHHTFAMDGTIHKQMRAAIARATGAGA